jgi:hypothetical protein
MRRLFSLLLVLCLPSLGCLGPRILADRTVGHVIAEEITVVGLCQTTTPQIYQKCKVRLIPGDVTVSGELWLEWLRKTPKECIPVTSSTPEITP